MSINPITMRMGGDWAEATSHQGCLGATGALYPGLIAASDDGASVKVRFNAHMDGWNPAYSFNHQQVDYHVSDYSLFWGDLRSNAEVRVAAWLSKGA